MWQILKYQCIGRQDPLPPLPKYAVYKGKEERFCCILLAGPKIFNKGARKKILWKGRLVSRFLWWEQSWCWVAPNPSLEKGGMELYNAHPSEKGFEGTFGEYRETLKMLSFWKTQRQGKGWLSCFVGRARTVSGVVWRTFQEFVEFKDSWMFPIQMWATLQK